MYLVLTLEQVAARFIFDTNQIDELRIGRSSPDHREPEIDLAAYGAVELGVARHHARIIRAGESICIVDDNSPNFVFVNGARIIPKHPKYLQDGDTIRLGHMLLHVALVSDADIVDLEE